MPKKNIITYFIVLHILFIFLQIHKQSSLVELSYKKQKNEKIKKELLENNNNLTQQWHLLQNKINIKNYAEQQLGMKKITLQQIRQLPS